MHSDVLRTSRTRRLAEGSKTSSGRNWVYILVAYYGFEYVRFQDSFFPFLSPFKIPMLLTLLLAAYVIVNFRRLRVDRALISILVIWVLILAWVPFATNNFHAFQTAKSMSMVMFSCFATLLIVDTREKFNILIKSFIGFFIVVSFWIIYTGGRGPGGFIYDENDSALLMVCALPIVFYSIFHIKNRKFRFFLILGLCSIATAIVLTYSRGGFVGLVAVIWFMIWLAKKRWKVIFIASVLALFSGGIALSLLPKDYVEDMSSITDKEDGTRNLRLLHWTTALEIFKDNPIFGVGPNNYPWTSNMYLHLSPYFKEGTRVRTGRQSHSLYFTLIPELGIVGIFCFLVLVINYRASMIKLMSRDTEESTGAMAKGLYVSLIGFLTAGAFISVLYYPIFWHLVFLALVFYRIEDGDYLISKTERSRNERQKKEANFNNIARSKI